MSQPILFEQNKAIAFAILNRPEKNNAMNTPLIKAFQTVLNQAKANDTCRVLVIKGNGKNFCAGADISWMQEMATGSYEENCKDAENLADLLFDLYHFPKPIILLAHGVTLGGGLGLIATADIVIASEDASFGFSEVKIGLTPSTISPYVISAIGERHANYYFLTGERFSVSQAKGMGLVHHVEPSETLLESAMILAEKLLQNSPEAMKKAKQLVRTIRSEKITPDLSIKTAEHLATIRMSPEAQEGLLAFLEKRKPAWVES